MSITTFCTRFLSPFTTISLAFVKPSDFLVIILFLMMFLSESNTTAFSTSLVLLKIIPSITMFAVSSEIIAPLFSIALSLFMFAVMFLNLNILLLNVPVNTIVA